MLVPQALEGVAAVALLAAAVRRVAGHAAGLLAGAALAVTPVAVLMFRFDNPDAMLTLLLTAAAYATVRAVTAPGTRGWASARAGWPSPAPSSASRSSRRWARRSWSFPASPWRTCGRRP